MPSASISTTQSAVFTESFAGRALLAVAATAFVALCAHISVPVFFTPVPFTLQPFAVILVGLALGPVTAFSAMMLYLAEGAAGLPVLTPQGLGGVAQLLGPTAGFLFSYPLAAALAGSIASRVSRQRFAIACLAGTAATAVMFTFGAGWLAHLLHLGPQAAMRLAVLPFLPGEAIKIAAAAGIFAAIQPRVRA